MSIRNESKTVNQIRNVLDASVDEVNSVCYPLFKNSPINYFDYVKFYDSGEMLYLGTSPEFLTKTYIHNLIPTEEELKLFSLSGLKATFLSHHMPLPPGARDVNSNKYNEIISCAAECDIYHRLYFIEKQSNYYRACGFGVKAGTTSIFNFYLNFMANLQQFIKYFEHKTALLMEYNVQKRQIILPNYHHKIMQTEKGGEIIIDASNLDFSIENPFQITLREKECLRLIAQGYTMKNAAKKMRISHRTVEQHIRNLKEKLGLSTKNQLVELWHENEQTNFG